MASCTKVYENSLPPIGNPRQPNFWANMMKKCGLSQDGTIDDIILRFDNHMYKMGHGEKIGCPCAYCHSIKVMMGTKMSLRLRSL